MAEWFAERRGALALEPADNRRAWPSVCSTALGWLPIELIESIDGDAAGLAGGEG